MSGPMERHWQPEARPRTRDPPPTAVEPGHHRQQEDTFNLTRFFQETALLVLQGAILFSKKPF
jgi:hypothetical protein